MKRFFTLLTIGCLTALTSGLQACYEPIPEDLFDHHYHAIVLTHGEGNRLEMARQFVRHNCVTTLQVADLMELLQAGGNRLELARAAYSSTVDPESYILLMDLLYGHNNRQALYQFIQSQQRNGNRRGGYRDHRDRDDDWDDRDDDYEDEWDDDRWDDDDRYRGNRDRSRGRGQAYGHGRRRGASVQVQVLSPFEEVMLILQQERDPSRRDYIARRFVSSHRVCTEEVILMMNHLNGAQRIMRFAKHSYGFVSDPYQYRQVIAHIPGRSRQAEFRTWLHWQRG